MDLQQLEQSLIRLLTACEQLSEALEAERHAVKAWRLSALSRCAENRNMLLDALLVADNEVRREIERACQNYDCSPARLFEAPAARSIRVLKSRVDQLAAAIRTTASRVQSDTAFAIDLLDRLLGRESECPTYSLGFRPPSMAGGYFHQVA